MISQSNESDSSKTESEKQLTEPAGEETKSKQENLVNVGVTRGQHALVACDSYTSFNSQHLQIYFSFEVQILMHIHSYLSKNEVIGLLGGNCFETNQFMSGTRDKVKILVVTKIYPA